MILSNLESMSLEWLFRKLVLINNLLIKRKKETKPSNTKANKTRIKSKSMVYKPPLRNFPKCTTLI